MGNTAGRYVTLAAAPFERDFRAFPARVPAARWQEIVDRTTEDRIARGLEAAAGLGAGATAAADYRRDVARLEGIRRDALLAQWAGRDPVALDEPGSEGPDVVFDLCALECALERHSTWDLVHDMEEWAPAAREQLEPGAEQRAWDALWLALAYESRAYRELPWWLKARAGGYLVALSPPASAREVGGQLVATRLVERLASLAPEPAIARDLTTLARMIVRAAAEGAWFLAIESMT